MSSPTRLRNFVFTLNNYDDDHCDLLLNYDCSYVIFGKETAPSTGTPHLQGYMELSAKVSFTVLLRTLPPGIHIERRRGSAKQARRYCMKDGNFVEAGTISKQGQRSDMEEIYGMVKAGRSDFELQEALPAVYARSYKAIDRMRLNRRRQQRGFSRMEVLVFVGPPGSGKTREAYNIDPDLYFLPLEKKKSLWWDGYLDQETILFDDFYGDIPYQKLLRLTDGYKFNVPIKGGFGWKQYTRVILTSNEPVENWYGPFQDLAALKRRITTVRKFSMPEEISSDSE